MSESYVTMAELILENERLKNKNIEQQQTIASQQQTIAAQRQEIDQLRNQGIPRTPMTPQRQWPIIRPQRSLAEYWEEIAKQFRDLRKIRW